MGSSEECTTSMYFLVEDEYESDEEHQPSVEDYEMDTQLHMFFAACVAGDLPQVRYYLDKYVVHKTRLNCALVDAVKYSHFEIVKCLIDKGADPMVDRNNPIKYATGNGDFEMVKYFTDLGVLKSDTTDILNIAVKVGAVEVVRHLLECGLKVTHYSVEWSVAHGYLDILKSLIEHGCDISFEDNLPFIRACYSGHLNIVKYLVGLGVDIKARNHQGIGWAARRGHIEIVEYLSKLGGDVTVGDNDIIIYASKQNNFEMVKLLIGLGADPLIMDSAPLRFAVVNNNLEMVRYLHELGCDLTCAQHFPLIRSCRRGYIKIVKYLVDCGVDIFCRDGLPFRFACKNKKYEVANYLISLGCDVTGRNHQAYRISKRRKDKEMMDSIVNVIVREIKRQLVIYLLNIKSKIIHKDLIDLTTNLMVNKKKFDFYR